MCKIIGIGKKLNFKFFRGGGGHFWKILPLLQGGGPFLE